MSASKLRKESEKKNGVAGFEPDPAMTSDKIPTRTSLPVESGTYTDTSATTADAGKRSTVPLPMKK